MTMMRCNPMALGGAAIGPMLGGMMMLASAGPFLLGLGVGAALVGGAVVARKGMQRRSGWRDDASMTTAGMGGPDPLPASTDTLPSSSSFGSAPAL